MDKTVPTQEEDYELIGRYFDFDLSESELVLFDQRMEEAGFQERFHLYKEMDSFIDEETQNQVNLELIKNTLKEKLTVASAAPTIKKEAKVIGLRRILRMAASILLLVTGGFVIRHFLNAAPSPEVLAETYWNNSTKVTFDNLRSTDNPSVTENYLMEASNLYESKTFSAVLSTLAPIEVTDVAYPKAAILRGEAQIELDQNQEAIITFQSILDHPSGTYKSAALWFQALAYLKVQKVDLAKANLKTIIQQKYPTANKATKLLKELE